MALHSERRRAGDPPEAAPHERKVATMLTTTVVLEESKRLCRVMHLEQVNALASIREKGTEWGLYQVFSIRETGQRGGLVALIPESAICDFMGSMDEVVKSRVEMGDVALVIVWRRYELLSRDRKAGYQRELLSSMYVLHPSAHRVYQIRQSVDLVGQEWVCEAPVVSERPEMVDTLKRDREVDWQPVSPEVELQSVTWPYRISA